MRSCRCLCLRLRIASANVKLTSEGVNHDPPAASHADVFLIPFRQRASLPRTRTHTHKPAGERERESTAERDKSSPIWFVLHLRTRRRTYRCHPACTAVKSTHSHKIPRKRGRRRKKKNRYFCQSARRAESNVRATAAGTWVGSPHTCTNIYPYRTLRLCEQRQKYLKKYTFPSFFFLSGKLSSVKYLA